MATTLQINSSAPVAGLGTSTYTVLNAGIYKVEVKTTLPYNASGSQLNSAQTSPAASAVQIVINLNGSAQVTVGGASTNPTPTQPSIGASASLLCAAADIITVVLTSANTIDNQPNQVKSVINLFRG